MIPPPYPRIAHLAAGRGTRDDLLLDATAIHGLLHTEVVIEEKLDGANVSIWLDELGALSCASRGGPGSQDRAGQLGPLRAWLASHDRCLRDLLARWPVLYGEWLLLTHGISYDQLPSYLVVLDLWHPIRGFAGVAERDAQLDKAGLVHPPELWRGVAGSVGFVESWIRRSTWGPDLAEGVVLRRTDLGDPRLAKLLRGGAPHLSDAAWRAGRPRNVLAASAGSWV